MESRTGWSCDGGWSEVGTASCVEDLCEYRLEAAAAWSQGGGPSHEGGELRGTGPAVALFLTLSATHSFSRRPSRQTTTPVNEQIDPSLRGT